MYTIMYKIMFMAIIYMTVYCVFWVFLAVCNFVSMQKMNVKKIMVAVSTHVLILRTPSGVNVGVATPSTQMTPVVEVRFLCKYTYTQTYTNNQL